MCGTLLYDDADGAKLKLPQRICNCDNILLIPPMFDVIDIFVCLTFVR